MSLYDTVEEPSLARSELHRFDVDQLCQLTLSRRGNYWSIN